MKIILTGATGVLGSQIMYEILELFISTKTEGTLFIIARSKGPKSALNRINELLSSDYTPKRIADLGLEKLHNYIEIIEVNWTSISDTFSDKIKGAYFIHSAGYVNLSTDVKLEDKIYEENTSLTKTLFNLFHPFIKKFIYISTAFSSGERSGIILNDFHNLDFIPTHRNAYERAKYQSEEFVIKEATALGLPYQILRPSVIGGKMMGKENNYYISKYMVFYLLAKFFHTSAKSNKEKQNIRFIVNDETGLNIIPVDYVAKIIVNTFEKDYIQQLNIVNNESFNIPKGLKIIMNEVDYTNFSFIPNTADFEYSNTIEKLYYESIGKHLKPYFIASANEYDTTELNAIIRIPKLDNEALTNMIRYARLNNFKDTNV